MTSGFYFDNLDISMKKIYLFQTGIRINKIACKVITLQLGILSQAKGLELEVVCRTTIKLFD